jgi:hypothetical protein
MQTEQQREQAEDRREAAAARHHTAEQRRTTAEEHRSNAEERRTAMEDMRQVAEEMRDSREQMRTQEGIEPALSTWSSLCQELNDLRDCYTEWGDYRPERMTPELAAALGRVKI